jgi:amidase
LSALATELARLDAVGQAELVRRGEVSARELVEAAIERIEALNPLINAVVTPLYEQARAAAAALTAESHLAGVPYLLKDLGASLAGTRQTSGSRALADHVSATDSELVRRLRRAGLVIVGKTSTPEFGNHSTTEPVLFGPVHNPWDPGRTVGGSSGGSAAAVAAGMVAAAHATDGAGSIRIPASCCGVFGLKPSRGRNSAAPGGGTLEGLAGLSVEHAVTRSIRDSAALLDATAGPAPGDPYSAPPPGRPFAKEVGVPAGRLRIAWSARPPVPADVHPACVRAARETADLLAELGHDVDEAVPEFDGEVLIEPYARIWAVANAESARDAERELGRPLRPDDLEETTWELVEYGRRFSALDLVESLAALGAAARRIGPFFETYAAWVTPTLARLPDPLGILNQSRGGAVEWWRFDSRFNPWNPIANMIGAPAMSLPLSWTDTGLPVGTLVTGRYGDEATLFRLASQLEMARPWSERLPPIHATTASSSPAAGTTSAPATPGS